MLSRLLILLPEEVGPTAAAIGLAAAAVGVVIWAIGARLSQIVLTLAAVALGSFVGLAVPRWTGWAIDPWATAVGGALLLGVTGFVLHRCWVATWFGVVLALWAAAAVVIATGKPESWTWPAREPDLTLWAWLTTVWAEVPAEVRNILLLASGAGLVCGIALGVMCVRIATVLLYSMAGITLAAGGAALALRHYAPQWLERVPGTPYWQVSVLIAAVVAGAALQLWLGRPRRVSLPKVTKPEDL